MYEAKPTTAVGLGIASGILIISGAALFGLLGGFPVFGSLGWIGLLSGIAVLVGAYLANRDPNRHATWGAWILIFSCMSVLSFGGFVIGLVLGIVGGALAVAWSPVPPTAAPTAYGYSGPYGVPVVPWRLCMGCGRWIPWAYNICPLCGTPTPVAPWVPRADAGGTAAPPSAPPPLTTQAPMAAGSFPPPAAPEPMKAPCPTCSSQAEYSPTAGRWYCPSEKRYF